MKETLPPILSLLMLFSLLSHSDGQVSFSSFERAKLHPVNMTMNPYPVPTWGFGSKILPCL